MPDMTGGFAMLLFHLPSLGSGHPFHLLLGALIPAWWSIPSRWNRCLPGGRGLILSASQPVCVAGQLSDKRGHSGDSLHATHPKIPPLPERNGYPPCHVL